MLLLSPRQFDKRVVPPKMIVYVPAGTRTKRAYANVGPRKET